MSFGQCYHFWSGKAASNVFIDLLQSNRIARLTYEFAELKTIVKVGFGLKSDEEEDEDDEVEYYPVAPKTTTADEEQVDPCEEKVARLEAQLTAERKR